MCIIIKHLLIESKINLFSKQKCPLIISPSMRGAYMPIDPVVWHNIINVSSGINIIDIR